MHKLFVANVGSIGLGRGKAYNYYDSALGAQVMKTIIDCVH
jgi:hypothetical protein